MNGKIILIILVCLVIGGVVVVGLQQQAETPTAQMTVEEHKGSMMKGSGSEVTSSIQEIKTQAKVQADDVKSKIKELIAKAKEYLNQGQYEKAVSVAKEILSKFDANSKEAKDILATATAKIKEMAQEKMGDVKNKLPAFGK